MKCKLQSEAVGTSPQSPWGDTTNTRFPKTVAGTIDHGFVGPPTETLNKIPCFYADPNSAVSASRAPELTYAKNPNQFDSWLGSQPTKTESRANGHMEFRENLPPGCPPSGASEIIERMTVFRLVNSRSISARDFSSQREMRPQRQFGVNECIARGLSVFVDIAEARKRLATRRFRNKKIARVHLDSGSGYIQSTFKGSHHTWWPYAPFDVVGRSKVVEG